VNISWQELSFCYVDSLIIIYFWHINYHIFIINFVSLSHTHRREKRQGQCCAAVIILAGSGVIGNCMPLFPMWATLACPLARFHELRGCLNASLLFENYCNCWLLEV